MIKDLIGSFLSYEIVLYYCYKRKDVFMKVHKEPIIIVIAIIGALITCAWLLLQPKDTSPTVDGVKPSPIRLLD